MSLLRLVKLWLWLSLLASLAGWTLSALGQLNRAGYVVFFGIAAAIVLVCRRTIMAELGQNTPSLQKICRRFRHPLPLAFAALTLVILIGGVLYPPTNHTAFTYRIPRVLNWLAHEGWFWVHTPDCRINTRACGIEWMATPLLLFTKSDRGLFLLNFIPYLLLPGLLFSVCTRLGVRPTVAWHWMWLLPTGYNFLLQAGSAGNDTFPAVYALAAIDFGCRAWASRRVSDLWYSIMAIALLTGAKASNLPLLLPWVVLIFALAPLLRRKWAVTSLVLLLAVIVSFLPTAILNVKCCGDWSGLSLEHTGMDMKNPIVGIWGNAFLLLLNNFVPPFFPQAGWWNQSALTLLPHAITAPMLANFEQGFILLGEMPTEDWCGIGFGISALLAVFVIASLRIRSSQRTSWAPRMAVPSLVRWAVMLAAWVALVAYCAKSGMVTASRLISPYYPLMLPLLFTGAGAAEVVRRRWWRAMVWAVFLLAFAVLIVTPPRPLWPAQTILSRAVAVKPGSRTLTRALSVYAVYRVRSDPLAAVRELLPPNLKIVGFMGTPDDIDISFWRPYGSKRVEHILANDPLDEIRRRGIEYGVVSGLQLHDKNLPLDAWLQRTGAELLATTNVMVKVADGPQPWHIVRFRESTE
jgi:hypothetical protein